MFNSASQAGSSVTMHYDTATFQKLMEVAGKTGNADLKARVFAAGAEVLKEAESGNLFTPVLADTAAMRKGMHSLLMSDVNGVIGELASNQETRDGSALATYAKSALNAKEFDQLAEVQVRLSLGNDLIAFQARFGGVAREISIPVENVSAIYARENGHGMAFDVPKAAAVADATVTPAAPAAAPPPRPLSLAPAVAPVPDAGAPPGPARVAPSVVGVGAPAGTEAPADPAAATGPTEEPPPEGGTPRGGRPRLTRIK